MSVLTAINEACPDLGLAKLRTIIGADDLTASKLLDIAHDAGDDIARRGDWSQMLSATAITVAPWQLPADFGRLIPGGAVNVIAPAFQRVRGPLSSDQMASITSGAFGASSRMYYAFQNGAMVFSRALAVGETVGIQWVRRAWIFGVSGAGLGGTPKQRATDDGDYCLFPERLLSRAIVWRFRRETGLNYQDQMAEWEADLAMELRQDRGVTT
jgi:hypothetical protein